MRAKSSKQRCPALCSVVCVSYLELFMKTPTANAVSESESWVCHQLGRCIGIFAYCAMDCCVGLLEKAKNIAVFA